MNKTISQKKVILVTGAGEGIGKATALKFSDEGYAVACVGRHQENTDRTTHKIQEQGGEAITLLADISNYSQMEEICERISDKWGCLDVVFANAGINGVWAPIQKLTPEEFENTVRINLNGTFHTIKAMMPLLKIKGGAVIITSSVNGTRMFSNSGATAYSCTKAAQVAMMKMLALELSQYRIRVNCICPGAIHTHISDNTETRKTEQAKVPVEFPEGKIPLTGGDPGSPTQCADLVYYLGNGHASHVTGSVVYVDGAQSLLQG